MTGVDGAECGLEDRGFIGDVDIEDDELSRTTVDFEEYVEIAE